MAENKDMTLEQEIADLETQYAESQAADNEPVEEKVETSSEGEFVEKDGDVYFTDEKVEAESEEKSEEKSDEEPKEATETDSTPPVSSLEKVEEKVEEPGSYQGKSREDIIRMHQEANKKISEQGNELGDLRKKQTVDDMSDKEVMTHLTSKDLEKILDDERDKLENIDPYDSDSLNTQRGIISAIESDVIDKKTDESLNRRFIDQDNKDFIKTHYDKLQDDGIDVSKEEYDEIIKHAEGYHENGKFTERSVAKAIIDKYGIDKFQTFYTMNGEEKARTDIKEATGKVRERVDVRGSGKNSSMIRVGDMSRRELDSKLDSMSIEEINALYIKLSK